MWSVRSGRAADCTGVGVWNPALESVEDAWGDRCRDANRMVEVEIVDGAGEEVDEGSCGSPSDGSDDGS